MLSHLKTKVPSKSLFFIPLFMGENIFALSDGEVLSEYYYDIVAVALIFVLVSIVLGFFYFGFDGSIEKEKDIVFDHSYDYIHEHDNKIPPWFSYLFFAIVAMGIFYLLYYHVFSSGGNQASEYDKGLKLAELKKVELIKSGTMLDENTITPLADAAAINNGKEIFIRNCAVCHTEMGGGLVGPNLTDDYWIHGGDIKNVYVTIKEGVPTKGMISWKTQLNPRQILEVASFILTLRGTNPPNQKAPEGVLYHQPDLLNK